MNSQSFALLLARFDTIESQNKDQLELLEKHIEKYDKTAKVVERHSTYFSICLLGIPVGFAALANKLGWKGI